MQIEQGHAFAENERDADVVDFVRDPNLPHVEARFSHYRRGPFKKHTHDTYAIGAVLAGVTDCTLGDTRHIMRAGQIALINPEQVHSCNPRRGSALTYCMFYVHPCLIEEIADQVAPESAGQVTFECPSVFDPALCRTFLSLYRLLRAGGDPLEAETSLVETLARLVAGHSNRRGLGCPLPPALAQLNPAHEYLLDNMDQNTPLRQLAGLCGLSPYHFLRSFRGRFGLPPHAFLLQHRIRRAKQWLAQGRPIAQVAADAGFADQSHFARSFKSAVGATPGQYRRAPAPSPR